VEAVELAWVEERPAEWGTPEAAAPGWDREADRWEAGPAHPGEEAAARAIPVQGRAAGAQAWEEAILAKEALEQAAAQGEERQECNAAAPARTAQAQEIPACPARVPAHQARQVAESKAAAQDRRCAECA